MKIDRNVRCPSLNNLIISYRCKQDMEGWSRSLTTEATKLVSSSVDAVSAVSSVQACYRRCQDMQGCEVFAFSNSGYSGNCQITRIKFDLLARNDFIKDEKWDLYTLRASGGGGGGYYPPNNDSKLSNDNHTHWF